MKTEIILIVGLPGSGKSHYIKGLTEQDNFSVFDDFYSKAEESKIESSVYYDDLIEILDKGGKCIISDIVFCQKNRLDEIKKFINENCKVEFDLKIHFFKNDPENCRKNIIKRGVEKINGEISFIESNGKNYLIGEDADKIIDVYSINK